MSKKFWGSLAVGLLGLCVGISYLVMAFGESSQTRNLIIGVVCAVLGSAWLIRTFLTAKTR